MPTKMKRPKICKAKSIKAKTGCGNLYITIGYDNGNPIEVFATLGKAGGCSHCQNEALTRAISLGLKYGVPIKEYVDELEGLGCPNPHLYPEEEKTLSCPDALAKILKENSDGNFESNLKEDP